MHSFLYSEHNCRATGGIFNANHRRYVKTVRDKQTIGAVLYQPPPSRDGVWSRNLLFVSVFVTRTLFLYCQHLFSLWNYKKTRNSWQCKRLSPKEVIRLTKFNRWTHHTFCFENKGSIFDNAWPTLTAYRLGKSIHIVYVRHAYRKANITYIRLKVINVRTHTL